MCLIKVIEQDLKNYETWNLIGNQLNDEGYVNINEQSYNEIQCQIKSLVICPTYSKAWNSLGNQLKLDEIAKVGEEEKNKIQCYSKALDCDMANADAWFSIGANLKGNTVNIKGIDLDEIQCQIKAIGSDVK